MITVNLAEPARVAFQTSYRSRVGRLDITLFDADGNVLAEGEDYDDGGGLTSASLDAGAYSVRVAHRHPDVPGQSG